MLNRHFIFLIFTFIAGSIQAQPRLDHFITITAYDDYEATLNEYSNDGFTIKKGRLHSNGLLNNHIKFEDQTYLELITLTKAPEDELTRTYAGLMANREQAVYVVLQIESAKEITDRLNEARIKHNFIEQQLWNYITFPARDDQGVIFLIEMKTKIQESPQWLKHKNGAARMNEVFVYGGKSLQKLLTTLNLDGITYYEPDYGKCIKYLTSTGELIVILEKSSDNTKIPAVVFGNANGDPITVRNFN